jgi:hypothetical protein
MSVAGDTTYIAGGLIGIIEADAIAQLEKVSVTRNLCKVKTSPAAETISWIMYNDGSNVINADDVANVNPGTVTPTTLLNSVKKTATMTEYSVMTHLYDYTKKSTVDDPETEIGAIIGNAVAAKIDELLNANFDGFSSEVGTSTVAITVDDLFDALSNLEAYENDGIFAAVLHRKQIWGARGLFADLVTNNNLGGAPSLQQEGLVNGWVNKVAGMNLYNSNQLTETASAIKGGIFGRNAFGWGYVGSEIAIEFERQGSFRRDAYMNNFFAGTIEIQDSAGCEIWTLTSAL